MNAWLATGTYRIAPSALHSTAGHQGALGGHHATTRWWDHRRGGAQDCSSGAMAIRTLDWHEAQVVGAAEPLRRIALTAYCDLDLLAPVTAVVCCEYRPQCVWSGEELLQQQ
jgi:hypothetical protein